MKLAELDPNLSGRMRDEEEEKSRPASLKRVLHRARTAGEEAGHPFRGNQWVGGEGGGAKSGDEETRRSDRSTALGRAVGLWSGDMAGTDAVQREAEHIVSSGQTIEHTDQGITSSGDALESGVHADAAAAMLDTIESGVRNGDTNDEEMFRGMGIEGIPSETYHAGDEVTFALGAFTTDGAHAEQFARFPQSDESGPWPVVFRIAAGDASVADLRPHSEQAARENELVTGGTFRITGTEEYTPEALDPWGNPETDPDFMEPEPITIVDLYQVKGPLGTEV